MLLEVLTELKKVSDGLITRLYVDEGRIFELEDTSGEWANSEQLEEKRLKKCNVLSKTCKSTAIGIM